MLDDLKYIHEKDQQDALGTAAKEGDQLRVDLHIEREAAFRDIHNVVHSGMGGSGWPVLFTKAWAFRVPLELVRDYDIPAYVGGNTLFIADSFSGNTEETMSALDQAQAKGAQIVVISKGGKLQQIAEQKGLAYIKLPEVSQPRFAALVNLKAILLALTRAKVLNADEVFPMLQKAADVLDASMKDWLPTVPTKNNPAKQLAQEMLGKSVVVYAGPKMFPAAYKWKICINENAKQIAWTNQLPEFSHNEFIGWSEQPIDKPYIVVDLRSNLEHPRVQKRFAVTARLLSGKRPEPHVIQAVGDNILEQTLWTAAFGDFVTLYLALLNGIDPGPVDLVEKFKVALDQ